MSTKRRDFLKKSVLLGLAGISQGLLGKINSAALPMFESEPPLPVPFVLPDLPYPAEALEPYIDRETMLLHHGKHHRAYVDNLNKALQDQTAVPAMEELLAKVSTYSAAVRNNAGGHYNHSLFWSLMKAPDSSPKNSPEGKLAERLKMVYGNQESFVKQFSETALKHFGSGWCWLVVTADKEISICSSPNQDNPLMDLAAVKGRPVLALDVWEHAYYLKYQNRRAEYIQNWWNLVNWKKADQLYTEAMGS